MGFNPIEIVPAVLLSEFLTGTLAGFTHHRMGNVDFRPKSTNALFIIRKIREFGYRRSISRGLSGHLKIALLLALCSIIGAISAVVIAVRLPKPLMMGIIGSIILAMGLIILFTLNKNYAFSWKRVAALGAIASFNKGLSGGGYGPIVTGGQLLAGVEAKSSIGITSLAEGLTCLVGAITYLIMFPGLDLKIAPYNIIGALLAVPFAGLSVKTVKEKRLKLLIGVITTILGILTVAKTISP
jgi:uncharacterized membrane protein YfcA